MVVSGGYEDDVDNGDVITYTGHGGRDQVTGKQVRDQKLEWGNLTLARNTTTGQPVRVVRGANADSEPGTSGYQVWRYRLVKEMPPCEAGGP